MPDGTVDRKGFLDCLGNALAICKNAYIPLMPAWQDGKIDVTVAYGPLYPDRYGCSVASFGYFPNISIKYSNIKSFTTERSR